MEHDLGLVDDHDYVGLGKCESDTSTKWRALDSPPSWGHVGGIIWPSILTLYLFYETGYEERCNALRYVQVK